MTDQLNDQTPAPTTVEGDPTKREAGSWLIIYTGVDGKTYFEEKVAKRLAEEFINKLGETNANVLAVYRNVRRVQTKTRTLL